MTKLAVAKNDEASTSEESTCACQHLPHNKQKFQLPGDTTGHETGSGTGPKKPVRPRAHGSRLETRQETGMKSDQYAEAAIDLSSTSCWAS